MPDSTPANALPPSWASLFETLPLGLMLADAQGRYIEVNAAAMQILGMDRESLLSSGLPEPRSNLLNADGSWLSPNDTPGVIALRSGKAVHRKVLGVVQQDGNTLWLELSAEPTPEGGVLVSFQDVTRQHLSETILAARARLAEIATSASLEEILRATLDETERLTGSCIGFYHFMEEDQKTLTLQAWSTRTEAEFCTAIGKGMHYSVDQAGVWADAARSHRPIIHNDYPNLPNRKGMPEGHAKVLRELVVPVLRGDRVMALLGVGNKPFPYGVRDLQTVQRLADLAWDIVERKRAEVALVHAQAQFQMISESAKDLIYTYRLHPQPGFEWVSPSCLAMTGYTQQEHYADPTLGMKIIHPEDAPRVLALLQELKDPVEPLCLRWVKKDGIVIWTEQVNTFIRDEAGKVVAIQGIARDVTSEVQSQRALRESEDRWHTVVEQAGDGFELLDEDGRYLQVNEASCRSLGYSREELLQLTVIDIDPTLSLDRFHADFAGLIDQPPVTFETAHRRKNGEQFPVEVTVSVIRMGEHHRALTLVRDITDRKKAEEETRAAKDQLQLVLDSLEAHVAVLDGRGNILSVNEPWRTFAHANGIVETCGTVEQVNYLDTISDSIQVAQGDVASIRQGLMDVLQGLRPSFQAEYPCDSPTERRWFRMQVLSMQSAEGGAVVTHENTTAERLALDSMKQANEQLSLAQRSAGAGLWDWFTASEDLIWSPELYELFGLDPARDVACFDTWRKSLHPADLTAAEARIALSLAERTPMSNEYRIVLPSGDIRWIHALGSVVEDPDGRVTRMAGICLDITHRKAVEAALAESEARLRAIIEHSVDAIGVSKEGTHVMVNPAYLAMFGFAPEANLVGTSILDLIAPESRTDVLQFVQDRATGHAVPTNYYTRGQRVDGTTFDLSVHGSTYELNGEVFTLVILRDITSRREAMRTLEASRRILAETERIGHVGGWEFDVDSQEQTWTEEVYRIHEVDLDFNPTVHRGMNFYTEGSRPIIENAIQRAIEHGEPFDLELQIHTAKGHLRAVHAIGHVDLERRKVYGFFQDITERKAIESALRESELRMREAMVFNDRLLATMPIGASVYQADSGHCILANEALARYLGGTQQELLKQDFRQIASWKASGILDVAERVLATDKKEHIEFRIQSTFGQDSWLACEFSTFSSLEGKNLLALTVDISERKQSELALLESEQKYRGLFDSMKEGFALHEVITNDEGRTIDYRFLDVNPAFVAMTRLTREQWIGHTVREILPGIEPRWIHEYDHVAQTGEPITFEEESRDLGRWYRVTAYRPAPRQFAVLVTDITEHKRSEAEHAHLEQQVAQAHKMESLGSLAGGVAHDMNNVLGAIMGLASVQQELEPEGSRLRKNMDTILKACTRGRTLVKGLLGFARQGLEEVRILDLNEVVREEVALLERTIPANVVIHLDLATGLRPIHGDPASLSHVLMNLCVNAMDAMPQGGTLRLRTRNDDSEMVSLEVSDTGCGMSPQVLEKALDPFFTTKGQGKGTGLGLAIVYGTVKAHHGRLELSSTPGLGTTVTMRFPATAAATEPNALSPDQGRVHRTLKVLVIDDDELIQDSLAELLRSLGHVPTMVGSGEEALQMLQDGLIVQVVVLDLNMPGLGGAGTLPLLRAAHPDLPVLLATGRADQTAMDLVAHTSKTILLPKPFSGLEIASHFTQLGL